MGDILSSYFSRMSVMNSFIFWLEIEQVSAMIGGINPWMGLVYRDMPVIVTLPALIITGLYTTTPAHN